MRGRSRHLWRARPCAWARTGVPCAPHWCNQHGRNWKEIPAQLIENEPGRRCRSRPMRRLVARCAESEPTRCEPVRMAVTTHMSGQGHRIRRAQGPRIAICAIVLVTEQHNVTGLARATNRPVRQVGNLLVRAWHVGTCDLVRSLQDEVRAPPGAPRPRTRPRSRMARCSYRRSRGSSDRNPPFPRSPGSCPPPSRSSSRTRRRAGAGRVPGGRSRAHRRSPHPVTPSPAILPKRIPERNQFAMSFISILLYPVRHS